MEKSVRKTNRLSRYDYSQSGAYFVTICTKDRKPILSTIEFNGNDVGDDILGIPFLNLSEYGNTFKSILFETCDFYECVKIDKYVIMPNHIHLIITIDTHGSPRKSYYSPVGSDIASVCVANRGVHRTPATPTIPNFIGTIKRFMSRKIGRDIFQRSFYDHVIRGEADYQEIWEYIDNNPAKWAEDELYEE